MHDQRTKGPRTPEVSTDTFVPDPLRFRVAVIVLTILASWTCAAVFITVQFWSVPPTDLARAEPMWFVFLDPFVISVALPFSTLVGLVLSPIAIFTLRDRDLLRSGLSVLGATILYIAVATPIRPLYAVLGSPLVSIACLLLFAVVDVSAFRPRFRRWLSR
jgi:hypothetical protein